MKFALYVLSWMGPILILVIVSRSMAACSMSRVKRWLCFAVLLPLLWLFGLFACYVAQTFHEVEWRKNNPQGIQNEDDIEALGDYPNVSAGWVLVGWIPLSLGLLIGQRRKS
jgi:hypothetical protein